MTTRNRVHASRLSPADWGRANLPEAAFLEPRFSYLDKERLGRHLSPLLGLFRMIMVRQEGSVKPAKRAVRRFQEVRICEVSG